MRVCVRIHAWRPCAQRRLRARALGRAPPHLCEERHDLGHVAALGGEHDVARAGGDVALARGGGAPEQALRDDRALALRVLARSLGVGAQEVHLARVAVGEVHGGAGRHAQPRGARDAQRAAARAELEHAPRGAQALHRGRRGNDVQRRRRPQALAAALRPPERDDGAQRRRQRERELAPLLGVEERRELRRARDGGGASGRETV